MKRFLGILVCTLAFNSCDDGNLIVESLNFDKASTQSCSTNSILFKLNENESLLLEIPKTTFENNPTVPGVPTLIDIDNISTRVIYRTYNGKISADNICNTIPPATPTPIEQWTATSGKIEITTTSITSPGPIVGSTSITGYNHHIAFKNISFDKGNGKIQTYTTFPFGDYITNVTPLVFGFDKTIEQCSTSKQIYNYTSGESLTLDAIDPALIVNIETPLNTPRIGLIGSTKNKLSYRLFSNGVLTPSYFCVTPAPTLPLISEEWNAVNGVSGTSGIIEVTTIKSGTTAYKHTIIIKKATLKKDNSSFKLGDAYNYGDLLTN